jgi:hypothetical protein
MKGIFMLAGADILPSGMNGVERLLRNDLSPLVNRYEFFTRQAVREQNVAPLQPNGGKSIFISDAPATNTSYRRAVLLLDYAKYGSDTGHTRLNHISLKMCLR